MRCSGVPFLKCTIWPFPLPTSVLLPIFIRGQALRIQIRSHALCPSHFKTILCIVPLFFSQYFHERGLVSQYKRADLFKNVCLHVCVGTFTKSFSISICVYFECPLFFSHKWKRPAFCAAALCFYHTCERH